MNKKQIKVVEENRSMVPTPRLAIRVFDDDFGTDYLICPECEAPVKIEYFDDGIEKWPKIGLPCEKCGKKWSVLM